MNLLTFLPGGGWRPGIGDPTFTGWLTVVAYFMAAWLCLRAARRSAASARATNAEALIWTGLTCFLIVLGINKQLDLQSGLTAIGRALAKEQGWYRQRHQVQVLFIKTVAASAALVGAVALWLARRHLRRLGLALSGACMLLAFVVIRAASFHKVDRLIVTDFFGMRINAWLELGGIATVGLGAWLAIRSLSGKARPRAPARRIRPSG